ncbi:hypothetical protein GGR33_000824 [Methylobacterium brachythecii]|uniref:Uncharacterized protein n=1 Tax=Methylobacterium brachythecii TaxID=1176177 RepID=A0A7W6F5H4_9HYPH|nr:hypothetical protein [Methylobacterium brachythecii]
MSTADWIGGFGLHAILLVAGLILGLIVVTR